MKADEKWCSQHQYNMLSVSDNHAASLEPIHPMDLLLSFDTTGSMSACIEEVQKCALELIERLFKDVPNLRISIVAHGDYCDHNVPASYVIKWVDFTDDVTELCRFIQTAGGTTGGDWEECYELVLRRAHTQLSWREGSQRTLVVMGDAMPHPADDPQNEDRINWRLEAYHLADKMGVQIHSVQFLSGQAYYDERATEFWESLASLGKGCHLVLKNFPPVVDVILGIVYREKGYGFLKAFEMEVREREGLLTQELQDMFTALGVKDKGPLDPNQNCASFSTTAFYRSSSTATNSSLTSLPDKSTPFDEPQCVLSEDLNASIKSQIERLNDALENDALEHDTDAVVENATGTTNGDSNEIQLNSQVDAPKAVSLKRPGEITKEGAFKKTKTETLSKQSMASKSSSSAVRELAKPSSVLKGKKKKVPTATLR